MTSDHTQAHQETHAGADDRGTGDGLMQLLQQIADDLDELPTGESQHVSALERTIKRVRAIKTLF